MRAKIIGAIMLSLIVFYANGQNDNLTTFILVRHAEKEAVQNGMSANKDPKLSEEGVKRAQRLVEMFSKTTINAVYSTPYTRTKTTVQPLAQSKSLSVIEYEPGKIEAIDKMLSDHQGKTIVVCGHSNTIPKIANYLTKSGDFKDFDDADYGNILIITLSNSAKSATYTWLRY